MMRSAVQSLLILALSTLPHAHASLLPGTYYAKHSSRAVPATDQCGNVDGPLKINTAAGAPPVTIGFLRACVCTSSIPSFLQTNAVAMAAVAVGGTAATTAQINSLVYAAADSATCVYPDNSAPQCRSDNPCGFTCINGFTTSQLGGTCECTAPNVVCDGVCTSSCPGASPPSSLVPPASSDPTPPPSSIPPSGSSSSSASLSPSAIPERRRLEIARRSAACERGLTVCGVSDWRVVNANAQPWECVNVLSDLESCGGCMVPFDDFSPTGVDCTALPGVEDVQCFRGACRVQSCADGYVPSKDRTECARKGLLGSLVHELVGFV